MRYTSWGIIIDDIVFPDGRTAMRVLGGGGIYAVAGMRLWSADVGILSNVAYDFDPAILAGLDIKHGLYRNERTTPRAWQLFEVDGQRTQIPRNPMADWSAQLAWPDDFAERMRGHGVSAAHMLSRGVAGNAEVLASMVAAGIRISLEPIIEEGMDAAARERVMACLPYAEIFSPGLQELRVLLGDVAPDDGVRRLAAHGPAIVALRRGAEGSLVYHRASDRLIEVPAAPVTVVDVTGGGNAYVGGLLVGWCESGDIRLAAASASVSAALALEQIGPPIITPAVVQAADQRRSEMLGRLRELNG
ncbi:MAG TPA: carbohydrate kinase family protein [Roseiflexaceae bacterium]|nr:carbohydrate kinase family protein [Roseiflexaceae bacterium]HMP40165.1 carbohydrate kinase family protein [Roseiflexaceae bacterium]